MSLQKRIEPVQDLKMNESALAKAPSEEIDIKSRILTVRGVQVMIDRDLAQLYGVDVKRLNEQVKRNAERFPSDFMFQLSKEECLRSQIATLNEARGKHLKYMPYAFTESGIAMLSGVLRSPTAVEVNIRIMRAFVAMRHALASLAPLLARVEANECRQIADQARNDANQILNEERFQQVFKALEGQKEKVQGVFYDGQLWDACSFVEKLIAKARTSILLIDNWVDGGTLDMLAKKRSGVAVEVVSSKRGNKLAATDIAKFNVQYGPVVIKTSATFHDRFLILDDKELYLIGASLKDLGKKCFGFTKMDASEILGIKARTRRS